jgi:hypothetical protein
MFGAATGRAEEPSSPNGDGCIHCASEYAFSAEDAKNRRVLSAAADDLGEHRRDRGNR